MMKLSLLICLLGFSSMDQVESQDPAIAPLTARVTSVEQTANANKNKLTTLSSDMTRIQSSWNSDYNYLNGKINTINTNLSLVYGIIDSNRATILHLESKLDATNAEISAANEKIAKLQNINKIWANNFRTVKKTFDELRRKVKFAVPSLKIVKAVGV